MKKEKKSSCAVVVKTKPEDYQKENLKVSDRTKSVNSVVRMPQSSSSRISFRSKQFPRARAGTHYDGRFNKRRSPDGDVHSNSKRRVVFSPPHGERGVWRPFSTGDFCHLLLLFLVISSTDHPVPCRDGGGSKLQKMMSFETMINNCISEL